MVDIQTLSRNLLILCQILDYCQLLLCISLILQTDSVLHYDPAENPDPYFEWNSSIHKLTCQLNWTLFKYFSNINKNTHMVIVLKVFVNLMPTAGAGLACLLEIY